MAQSRKPKGAPASTGGQFAGRKYSSPEEVLHETRNDPMESYLAAVTDIELEEMAEYRKWEKNQPPIAYTDIHLDRIPETHRAEFEKFDYLARLSPAEIDELNDLRDANS